MSKPEDLAAAKHSTNRAAAISASVNAASEVTCAARVSGRNDIASCAKLNRFSNQPNDQGYLMGQEQHQTVCVPRELYPCPFCDSAAIFEKGRVRCSAGHGCSAGYIYARVDEWNHRTQPVASEPTAWMYSSHRGTDLVRNRWSEDMRKLGPLDMTETPLFRNRPAPAIPEGYALVPIEPTREMFVAANKEDNAAFCGGSSHGATVEDVWYAMVDAATKPTIEGSTDDQ